jgi:hypothetical protein
MKDFIFTAHDKYLQGEWKYQQAIARLYKFQLYFLQNLISKNAA